MESMLNLLVPAQFHNNGITLVADNYFFTPEIIKNFLEKYTTSLCTMRPGSMKRLFGTKNVGTKIFQDLCEQGRENRKYWYEKNFVRKVVVHDHKISNSRSLTSYLYFDKRTKGKPVGLVSSDKFLHNTNEKG